MDDSLNMQIFRSIEGFIADTEFGDAQFTFFEKVKDKFDEGEENKLEYTSIFEEYVYIVENLIDAKLKEKYSED
jgi:ADP-ribosylation factor 2-binding protein